MTTCIQITFYNFLTNLSKWFYFNDIALNLGLPTEYEYVIPFMPFIPE